MSISYWRMKDRYYRLTGSMCKECGADFFPPVYKCKKCNSEDIIDKEMPKNGTILTYTILHEIMKGFEDEEPLTLAIIRLDNGVKVLGQIVDTQPDRIQIGDPVKAVFRRVRIDKENGQIMYGYKFVKI